MGRTTGPSARRPLSISHLGLDVEPLQNVGGGVVWAAICLDYPGHSFSELGIFYGMSTLAISRSGSSSVLQKESMVDCPTKISSIA